jgi:molecular chaperone GrpE
MSKTKTTTTDLHAQIKTLDENWKRALADYQNLLRRVESDKKEFIKLSNANLIARLLPSLDIIEMAAAHSQDIGVQMAARQFSEVLVAEGLQTIIPTPGDSFDHRLHECTETVENTDEKRQNAIAEVILKGYKINDYVLRPARVKVYKSQNNSMPNIEINEQMLNAK